MTTHSSHLSGLPSAQHGLSLVTTLLFMVAALMLGVSVLSVNVMQERTIGNTKDRDLALQAAEAALRDAERDLVVRKMLVQNILADAVDENGGVDGVGEAVSRVK